MWLLPRAEDGGGAPSFLLTLIPRERGLLDEAPKPIAPASFSGMATRFAFTGTSILGAAQVELGGSAMVRLRLFGRLGSKPPDWLTSGELGDQLDGRLDSGIINTPCF